MGFLCHHRVQYLILDEAHVMRNPNSKVAQAVKSLPSRRRLLLTGTPIHNQVLVGSSCHDPSIMFLSDPCGLVACRTFGLSSTS